MNSKLMLRYIKLVWPIHRNFVRNKPERCRTCTASELYASIVNGCCFECRNYVKSPTHKLDKTYHLNHLMSGYKRALLLLSGGKDSAYIIDRLYREYPHIKLDCIFINNGFSSKVAVPNATYLAHKYESDLIVYNSSQSEFYSTFRNAFLNLKNHTCSSVVDHADGSLIFKIACKYAKDNGYDAAISGLTAAQLKIILNIEEFAFESDGIQLVNPLAAWPVSDEEMKSIGLPHGSNPLETNSQLVATMCALDALRFNYIGFEPEFARLVREGRANRRQWIHSFEFMTWAATSGKLDKEIKQTLGRLQLTKEEVLCK